MAFRRGSKDRVGLDMSPAGSGASGSDKGAKHSGRHARHHHRGKGRKGSR